MAPFKYAYKAKVANAKNGHVWCLKVAHWTVKCSSIWRGSIFCSRATWRTVQSAKWHCFRGHSKAHVANKYCFISGECSWSSNWFLEGSLDGFGVFRISVEETGGCQRVLYRRTHKASHNVVKMCLVLDSKKQVPQGFLGWVIILAIEGIFFCWRDNMENPQVSRRYLTG